MIHRADDVPSRHRKAPIAHERAQVDIAAAEIAERNIRQHCIADGKIVSRKRSHVVRS